MKKLWLFVMLSPITLLAQENLSGIWRIREMKNIEGPRYSNAIPVMMKIQHKGNLLTVEVTDLMIDHDSVYTYQLQIGAAESNESLTASGKKKMVTMQWDTTRQVWVRESVIYDKQETSKAEREIKEDFRLFGNTLYLNKKSDMPGGGSNESYSIIGTYEKITSEDLAAETAKGKGIVFTKGLTWEQVKAKARKEKKYIFVDCYATWCGPCRVMDREVFTLNLVGDAMREKFVAIKVQMDSTKNDLADVRALYPAARELEKKYVISALPTYLFFSPDGEPLHKAIGQQKSRDFVKLVNVILNKPDDQLYTLVNKARNKKIPYSAFPALEIRLRNEFGEKELGIEIAKRYKEEWLDQLPDSELRDTTTWKFIKSHPFLINPDDRFFKLCYTNAALVDQLVNYKAGGWAEFQLQQAVARTYIQPVITKAKTMATQPDWVALEKKLGQQYDTALAATWVLDSRVDWYRDNNLNKEYLQYILLRISRHNTLKMLNVQMLNEAAWFVFLYSSDKALMEQALEWVTIAVGRTVGTTMEEMVKDTKAWLLYKMGRKDEAMAIVRSVIRVFPEGDPNKKVYQKRLETMQMGEQPWTKFKL